MLCPLRWKVKGVRLSNVGITYIMSLDVLEHKAEQPAALSKGL